MSQTPVTTQPGPDQARLQEIVRRVAEVESTEAPVLTAYLDLRPEAHGEDPGRRAELVVLRDRLREVQAAYEPHTPAAESLAADVDRLQRHLEDEADRLRAVEGLAVFACDAAGLWETVTAPVPFETQVSVGPTADLFQLAGLVDEASTTVVALVDTNTCRLFLTRRGALVERPGPDEPPDEHRRHDQGGWSQARYQRHVDMQDKRFAAEAGEAISRLIERTRARHLVVAGDERAVSVLERELPPSAKAVLDHVERIGMHASTQDVAEEVAPVLAALRAAEEQDAAQRAIAGWRAGDLGVVGIDAVAEALERGQVHELVIDEDADVDETLRAELVRQAALTSAEVVTVKAHADLARLGGVAATLRFRL
ncbi:MAG TPA: Vms1/Ankzf1 family peptidyl-tRNA hydrolase [Candidatus Limnocylindria bacterium]|nr:Vms1/Ankzf1 family peptidyl-tRNA hydrolase [Candidatus Limnocylindria bacterium]